jgi:CRISPR/Cas system CSM-associated protein Csm4 (group 5 of RAMP superfamily)
VRAADLTEPMRVAAPAAHLQAHWLLSLFTPAAADAVDWGRGSYAVLARGGRIDSPSPGSGDLKKQIQMVAEGSVLYVDGVPLGAAADVAPDGFAHPVFRAGFALAIPLPEVH